VSNYTDWRYNEKFNSTNSVPDSCCNKTKDTKDCGKDALTNPAKINTKVSCGLRCESSYLDSNMFFYRLQQFNVLYFLAVTYFFQFFLVKSL